MKLERQAAGKIGALTIIMASVFLFGCGEKQESVSGSRASQVEANTNTRANSCGDPPPVANESLKGELAGKAQLVTKYLGSTELSGRIETSKTEIFSKYQNAEETRSNQYFEYQVCLLIMSDRSMTTQEKLASLKEVRKEISKPMRKDFDVIIRSAQKIYDNSDFGEIDPELSRALMKIDDQEVTEHKFDEPFGSHLVKLTPGEHVFDIYISAFGAGFASIDKNGKLVPGVSINDNCKGSFVVSRSTTLRPRVKLGSYLTNVAGHIEGSVVSCELVPE